MANISILTVGDSSRDTILSVDDRDTGLQCDLKSHKCEITFNYGEKIPVKAVYLGFGGSALNCAVGFKRLGFESGITTIVGNDESGKEIIKFLHLHKVGLRNVKVSGATNEASIISYKGERTVFSYHSPRDYSQTKVSPADWIYLASAGRGSNHYIKDILPLIESGSKLAFNPGSWQLKNFEAFAKIIRVCRILILNRGEADMIFGTSFKVDQQLKKMCEMGAKIAVITDGANGAYFASGSEKFHLNAEVVRAVDSTGAGDAFAVGFICGEAYGRSIEESAKWGMLNAGSVIEQYTANKGLLSLNEIEDRYKKGHSFRISII